MPKIIKKPSRDILEKLYETQRLTTIQIAERYKVSKPVVRRWLRSYGIELRLPGRGLVAQGKRQPTREELIQLLYEQELTYQEIADMFGATAAQAVSYWMEKYDIPQRPAEVTRKNRWYREKEQPQFPTKEEFLQLYEQGLSVEQIAGDLNIPIDALRYHCKKLGIQFRLNGWKGGQRFTCQDGHLVSSVFEQRVDDWLYEHHIEHMYEPSLPFDRRSRADFLANGYYIEIWGVKENKRYLARKLHKTQQYKLHNLPLIEIEAYDFDNRPERKTPWQRRLQVLLI